LISGARHFTVLKTLAPVQATLLPPAKPHRHALRFVVYPAAFLVKIHVQNFITFPKNNADSSHKDRQPSPISAEQLKELHIKL
jgi:hypothetical protein